MTTIEEITDILKDGFADVCEVDSERVDIYNVQETSPSGTYTYDASLYFRDSDTGAESVADALWDRVTNSQAEFNQALVTKIGLKQPALASKISMSVDNSSGKFTRSLNKGKSRPRFDRIVPVIESFGAIVENPDFLEIKDVDCVRDPTKVTTSLVVHTNLLNEKIQWRVKLSSDPNLETVDGFDDWMVSTVASQKQSHFTNTAVETTVSNKAISTPFTNLTETEAYGTQNAYYVYVMVFLDSHPTFSTLFVKTV
jgi:hypothetical protein